MKTITSQHICHQILVLPQNVVMSLSCVRIPKAVEVQSEASTADSPIPPIRQTKKKKKMMASRSSPESDTEASKVGLFIIISQAVPNICFIFASGPNRGPLSYLVFNRIAAVGSNMNSGHVTSVSVSVN